MNAPSLDLVAWVIVLGVVVVFCNRLWRRDAKRAVVDWCAEHSVDMDETTFTFRMGRPGHVSVVGTQGEERYLFRFSLHSGLFRLPSSVFRVWGKVVLQDRARID